jgi:hypothetical protein
MPTAQFNILGKFLASNILCLRHKKILRGNSLLQIFYAYGTELFIPICPVRGKIFVEEINQAIFVL